MSFLSLDLKVERESQFNTAGGSEFQVRGAAVLNKWQMMSVEIACTAVGRTTIECCVCWCATRCAGSDTAEMTSAESWTSARPTLGLVDVLMSDRCQINGNGQLINFNSLETTCLHSHTAYNKDNMTCCELSHVPGENERIMLHDKTWFLTLTPPPRWKVVPERLSPR